MIIATPIGNLSDISPRAVQGLERADLIACEDTRHTRALLSHLGLVGKKLVSLHEHNEHHQLARFLNSLEAGLMVVLVSDAGLPTISDPGRLLVSACHSARINVSVIPGASAVLSALAVSGLGDGRFCFDGFLPRKGAERSRRIAALASETRTTILFESPRRLAVTLEQLEQACGGERNVVVARELTKIYEEVWKGSLSEAVARAKSSEPRGEHTIVLEGAPLVVQVGPQEIESEVIKLLDQGLATKEISERVAAYMGVPKREVYGTVLRLLADRSRPG